MTEQVHQVGKRVRSIFDDRREGVVIEVLPDRILIEFEAYDEDEREHYTHRLWLPSRHWEAA
jgi:hypothetical protein